MGKFVQRDVYILINGTAVSDHANNCSITDQADEVEMTSFSPNAYKEFGQGLHDATIAMTFFADFGAGTTSVNIHNLIQPLYASGTPFSVEVRPTSNARGTTNPAALMTGRIYAYSGIQGGIGAAATFDCNIRNAGTAGLTWVTS